MYYIDYFYLYVKLIKKYFSTIPFYIFFFIFVESQPKLQYRDRISTILLASAFLAY